MRRFYSNSLYEHVAARRSWFSPKQSPNNKGLLTCTATHLPWRAVPGNAVRRTLALAGSARECRRKEHTCPGGRCQGEPSSQRHIKNCFRFYFVMVLAILLQACSGISIQDMLNPPTNTPTITVTPTITFTPTITSTATKTPTITPTTTIVHIPTQDPNQPTATFIPIPIFVGDNTITPIPMPTEFRPGPGFQSVLVSESKIFWGSCKHNKTKITAEVENPDDVYSVVIFVRVKSLKKEDYTPWTTGDAMHDHRNGTYSYTLVGSNIEGHNHFKDSWVFFQLVATDEKGEDIGRTMIYTNAISLSPCK